MLEPLMLQPVFKDYLWGGEKLRTDFNKKTDLNPIAESWELCCHKDGDNIIQNGAYAGKTLRAYLAENPKAVCAQGADTFPIMIKLIDAKDNLSVQVHPDNEYALRVEGEYGKTEMWYVVDCEPDAALIFGFNKEVTRAEFEKAISENTLLDIANVVPVKKGDVFFIEAQTLHAIGKGILIAEIQQNSNTTYRVYDYGRVGPDGNPRALHVQKALDVTKLSQSYAGINPKGETKKFGASTQKDLAACAYFDVKKLALSGEMPLTLTEESFSHLLVLAGQAVLTLGEKTYPLQKGDSVFIPAQNGAAVLVGDAEIILSMLPVSADAAL